MQNNTIKELPDSICLAKEKETAADSLREAVRSLQGGYRGLSGITELAPVSTDLADITLEWLREKIERRLSLIRADESLTENERIERLQKWGALRARATQYINAIQRAVSAWPSALWKYDETISNFYCSNITEVAEAAATHIVTDEAKTHWRMVQSCLKQIRELRAWEDEHDVKSQLLADSQCLTAEAFAEMWISGGVKFDRKTAEKYCMVIGNFHDPRHPERVII